MNITAENLTIIFQEETNKIGRSFPQSLKKLLVINTKEPIYVSDDIADQFKNTGFFRKKLDKYFGINKMSSLIKQASAHLKFTNAAAVNVKASYVKGEPGEEMTLIAINEEIKLSSESDSYTREMKVFDNYNHEMGHLLVENGTPSDKNYDDLYSRHLAECAAEAFKAIRHHQEFGNSTDYVAMNNFSQFLVSGESPIHYTDIINHKIREISLTKDLSKLSMKEVVIIAGNIAKEYSLTEKELKNITEIFKPTIKCYKKTNNYTTMARECFNVMEANKDNHNIYRIGKLFLNSPYIIKYHIPRHADFWKDAYKKMEAFEKESEIDLNILKNKESRAKTAIAKIILK